MVDWQKTRSDDGNPPPTCRPLDPCGASGFPIKGETAHPLTYLIQFISRAVAAPITTCRMLAGISDCAFRSSPM
jgi:hypothetical protein